LGAILSQFQADNRLHPVAYVSQSVSQAEANYAVTDLKTLAVFGPSLISGTACTVMM